MGHITEEDVLKLAKLSKLSLTKQQLEKFRTELDEIVGYVESLSDVDVTGLEPTNQVTGLVSVMRDDVEVDIATPEELLKNLPDREGNHIKVKRVLS